MRRLTKCVNTISCVRMRCVKCGSVYKNLRKPLFRRFIRRLYGIYYVNSNACNFQTRISTDVKLRNTVFLTVASHVLSAVTKKTMIIAYNVFIIDSTGDYVLIKIMQLCTIVIRRRIFDCIGFTLTRNALVSIKDDCDNTNAYINQKKRFNMHKIN